MSAQDHLNEHQFHVEYKTGEAEDFTVPAGEAQDRWDDLTDNGLHGRVDISHARWSRPGKTGGMKTQGSMGRPASERAPEPTEDERREASRQRSQAEMQAVADVNNAHDRRENRRSYYQRTGR